MDILYTKYAWFGLLIPILMLAIFWFFNRKHKTFTKNIDEALLKDVYPISFKKLKIKQVIHILIAFLLFVCILRPVIMSKTEKVETIKLDICIALDISPSMLAQDIRPDRLVRAKREIFSLLKYLPNYRVSLVLFSGQAMLQVPLTTDYSALSLLLDNVGIDYISNRGTDVTDALVKAKQSLDSSRDDGYKKLVLLITDGEDHSDGLSRILKQYKKDNVIVYSIGVGSMDGAPVPVYTDGKISEYLKDKNGKAIISKLNGTVLNMIASETGGKIYLVDQSTFNLRRIVDDIVKIEKNKSMSNVRTTNFSDLFQYFLFIAVGLLVFVLVVSNKQGVLFVLFFMLFMSDLNFASPFNFLEWKNNLSGNRYFDKQEIGKAINKYTGNTRINATNPITHYNLGNGLAVEGKPDEAEKEWQSVLDQSKNKNLMSQVYFNKGISKINQQDYSNARDMFINTLKLNPKDIDAKKNLELVLKKIEQQKQQQKQQNKQKKDNQDKNQKEKQKDEKEGQEKSQNQSKDKLDESEAKRILDQYKNDKTFNPSKEQKKAQNENNW
ncbi:MAG: hypothetical protein A2Y40_07450 [Candidatus Margulisbacteria bacterium GWF2_35_9]|nr:MAG: hypothetical protein A2Y40_07450 [Candidatus Margulisbacteria bacterium GWF2_35_9]